MAILLLVRQQAVRGAAETPTRDVGIVLKQMTEEGPLFEDETDQQPSELETPKDTAIGETASEALPAESEVPRTDASLPRLPTLGLGAPDQGRIADASAITLGSPATRSIGGKASVRVFGVEGVGAKFVYVFDRSISMEGAPLRAAKAQLVESLASLDSVHQFQIIFFNHEPAAWDITGGQRRIAFATDRNKRLAKNYVRGISASGGTYRRAALLLALRLRSDVVFFLTDADDPMPADDVADAANRAVRTGTSINTIQFGEGPTTSRENFLVKLARATGGQYAYVDTIQLGK